MPCIRSLLDYVSIFKQNRIISETEIIPVIYFCQVVFPQILDFMNYAPNTDFRAL